MLPLQCFRKWIKSLRFLSSILLLFFCFVLLFFILFLFFVVESFQGILRPYFLRGGGYFESVFNICMFWSNYVSEYFCKF